MSRRRRKKRVFATLPMKNSDFLVQKMVHPEIEVHPEICLHVSFFKIFVSVFTSFYEVFKSSESGDCVFCIHVPTIPKEWYLFPNHYRHTSSEDFIRWICIAMSLFKLSEKK